MPVFSMAAQSSPSWISPLTPVFSIITPFSSGRLGSKVGGRAVGVGVRNGPFGSRVEVGVGTSELAKTAVLPILAARVSEVPGESR